MEKIKIRVVFGQAECKAFMEMRDYDAVDKEFNSRVEAAAYVKGLNDANGYMECGVFLSEPLPLEEESINDLYFVQFEIPA